MITYQDVLDIIDLPRHSDERRVQTLLLKTAVYLAEFHEQERAVQPFRVEYGVLATPGRLHLYREAMKGMGFHVAVVSGKDTPRSGPPEYHEIHLTRIPEEVAA